MRIVIFLSTAALIVSGFFFFNRLPTKKKEFATQQTSMTEDMVISNMHLQEAYDTNQTVCIAAQKSILTKTADTVTCLGVTCTLRTKKTDVAFLSANQALINRTQQRCYFSHNITGTMCNATQQITLTAQHGTFDLKTKELMLDGNVTTEFVKEHDTQQRH
ncbi:hypothetical protein K2W90_00280 [Candidatus Babeliales bacterium]|nr:hypothetical protein [Candidatus Babeliales bacterium]